MAASQVVPLPRTGLTNRLCCCLHSDPLLAVVAAFDSYVRRRLSKYLTLLGITNRVYESSQLQIRVPRGSLYCLCTRTVALLDLLSVPAIVVCRGASIPDNVVAVVARAGVPTIDIRNLTAETLLRAMVGATSQGPAGPLAVKLHLASHPQFQFVPVQSIEAFLQSPRNMVRLSDICRALRVSRAEARRMLRSAGFERAEHLCTALRAETWIWFAQRGLQRTVFEHYLGISDRGTFRRACSRAVVTVPWRRDRPTSPDDVAHDDGRC